MMNLFLQSTSTFVSPNSVVNFAGMANMQDFWTVHQGPILDGLYWETYYNGDNATKKNFIYYENKLLGVPRFRQLRVANNSCKVYKYFQSIIGDCYGDYSYFNEDRTPYGIYNKSSTDMVDTA